MNDPILHFIVGLISVVSMIMGIILIHLHPYIGTAFIGTSIALLALRRV